MYDMVYYELLDHMKNGNCPVCSLIQLRTKQAMDGFLYESVNDPSIRRSILKAYGLCNTHSWQLQSIGDPLAHALIYGDLLHQEVDALKHPRSLLNSLEHTGCIFCNRALACEQQYEKAFLEAYAGEEFRKLYQTDGMLCLTHLKQAMQFKNIAMIQSALLSDTLIIYERVMSDLSQIKRKNDYRYMDEPWTDSERTAWQRAVAIVNDLAGLRK